MTNPFWKSKKFAYSMAAVITSLILALLPSLFDLDTETYTLLQGIIPLVVLVFILLITGHTVTDIAYAWMNRPVTVPLPDALHDLIDTLKDMFGPVEVEATNPATGETLKVVRQPSLVLTGNGEAITGELMVTDPPDLDAVANLAAEKAVARMKRGGFNLDDSWLRAKYREYCKMCNDAGSKGVDYETWLDASAQSVGGEAIP